MCKHIANKYNIIGDISFSHGDEYEDGCLHCTTSEKTAIFIEYYCMPYIYYIFISYFEALHIW
jgi:hypothetical protein